jgi:hypothetical protein
MLVQAKHVGRAALVGMPVLTALLWLASGREVFTKSGKAAQVAVMDPLFGDTTTQTQFVRGPIFGFYVGLDGIMMVTLACVAAGAIWWWAARRRRRATQLIGGTRA